MIRFQTEAPIFREVLNRAVETLPDTNEGVKHVLVGADQRSHDGLVQLTRSLFRGDVLTMDLRDALLAHQAESMRPGSFDLALLHGTLLKHLDPKEIGKLARFLNFSLSPEGVAVVSYPSVISVNPISWYRGIKYGPMRARMRPLRPVFESKVESLQSHSYPRFHLDAYVPDDSPIESSRGEILLIWEKYNAYHEAAPPLTATPAS